MTRIISSLAVGAALALSVGCKDSTPRTMPDDNPQGGTERGTPYGTDFTRGTDTSVIEGAGGTADRSPSVPDTSTLPGAETPNTTSYGTTPSDDGQGWSRGYGARSPSTAPAPRRDDTDRTDPRNPAYDRGTSPRNPAYDRDTSPRNPAYDRDTSPYGAAGAGSTGPVVPDTPSGTNP